MLIFLFFAAKRETEKLAAATKSAKIMILKLNKKNSLCSDSFLFLTLHHHNFLTLFSRGGMRTSLTLDSWCNSNFKSYIKYILF